jgi:hypothetical protein
MGRVFVPSLFGVRVSSDARLASNGSKGVPSRRGMAVELTIRIAQSSPEAAAHRSPLVAATDYYQGFPDTSADF